MLGFAYQYDQLHRIRQSVDYSNTGGGWTQEIDYATDYTYDANGNILTLNRKAVDGTVIDQLEYNYNYDADTLLNNRLPSLTDGVGYAGYGDIDNSSYVYNANGSLVKDTERDIDSVLWSVQNKPLSIDFGAANDIVYTYDAMGNRLSKTVAGDVPVTTYYLRDAEGNVLSVYESAADTVLQKEMHLYGSSRLGLQQAERGA